MNRLAMLRKTLKFSLVVGTMLLSSGCYWTQPKIKAPLSPRLAACLAQKPVVCPAPKIVEKIIIVPVLPKTGGDLDIPIIGEVERVLINPNGISVKARIDTGAASSSIHAKNIQLVERDGEKIIRFSIINPSNNKLTEFERKLHRKVLIKQKSGKPERRYVVKLWLSLGNIKELVDVTLANRSDFDYKLLVGRNFLTDIAIVDVSRQYTQQ